MGTTEGDNWWHYYKKNSKYFLLLTIFMHHQGLFQGGMYQILGVQVDDPDIHQKVCTVAKAISYHEVHPEVIVRLCMKFQLGVCFIFVVSPWSSEFH